MQEGVNIGEGVIFLKEPRGLRRDVYICLFCRPEEKVEGALAQPELLIKQVNSRACNQRVFEGPSHIVNANPHQGLDCQVTISHGEHYFLTYIKALFQRGEIVWLEHNSVKLQVDDYKILEGAELSFLL